MTNNERIEGWEVAVLGAPDEPQIDRILVAGVDSVGPRRRESEPWSDGLSWRRSLNTKKT